MDAKIKKIDAIDLTISPSPEPESRPSQSQRPQVPHHSRRDPQSTAVASAKGEAGRQEFKITPQQQQQQAQVHPYHLQKIIYTSDSRALRSVLLHLCQTSSALSGAVVRGLTPHSAFAQDIVNRHRNNTAAPVKIDEDNEGSAYERTTQRLASASSSSRSNARDPAFSNRSVHDRREELPSRHIVPREPLPVPSTSRRKRSHTDRLTAYSCDGPPAASRLPSIPRGSIVANHSYTTYSASRRPPYMMREPAQKKKCRLCHDLVDPKSEDICMYHPGRRVQQDGRAVYDCCSFPLDDAGCQFGLHIAADGSSKDVDRLKRPSASPPPGEERKRAKML